MYCYYSYSHHYCHCSHWYYYSYLVPTSPQLSSQQETVGNVSEYTIRYLLLLQLYLKVKYNQVLKK